MEFASEYGYTIAKRGENELLVFNPFTSSDSKRTKGVTMYRTSGEVEIVSSKTGEVFTLHYMQDRHELYDITVEPI